jgi:hypothetical protein
MEPDRIPWLIIAVLGTVSGIGMLAVRTSASETARLSKVWPVARLYNYRGVRIVVAALSFVLAAVGAAGIIGAFG